MITSKSGTAPSYLYAPVQATMDENGTWTQVGGGAGYNNGGTGVTARQSARAIAFK